MSKTDEERACYRTNTTDSTSTIKCIDVCIEYPLDNNNINNDDVLRVCRTKPYIDSDSDIKNSDDNNKRAQCVSACEEAYEVLNRRQEKNDVNLSDDEKELTTLMMREECSLGCYRALEAANPPS